MISIDDFKKLEIKVGTVISAEEIEDSDKLLKLMVDLAEENPRQILSGIKTWYKPEDLVGKQFTFITNLEPRMMMGLESQGMILCASPDGLVPTPLVPLVEVPNGTGIR
jgi:methionine--tRNA ligase beta chain